MTRTLALVLALSAAPASAQVLDPPPSLECQWVYEGGEASGAWSRRWVCPHQAWDITWRANIYVPGAEPMENANIVDFDRMSSPGFTSLRSCESYGYNSATKMADLISAYFNDADVNVRWTCARAVIADK